MAKNVLGAFFGSKIRPRLIKFFLENPKGGFYQTQIAKQLRVQIGSLQYELENLSKIGFLHTWWTKTHRFYELNPKFKLLKEVKTLFEKAKNK